MPQTKEYHRAWYEANRDEQLRKQREWREQNPLRQKCKRAAALANKRYPGKLTTDDVLGIFERCARTCHWCHREGLTGWELTLEHLQPFNDPSCIVVACYACNCARLQVRGGRRRTDEEKLAQQKAYERRSKERHAEKERARGRDYYERNKELVKARARIRALENPEAEKARLRAYFDRNREKELARLKQWGIENAEKRKAAKKAWNDRNKEKRAEYFKRWYEKSRVAKG